MQLGKKLMPWTLLAGQSLALCSVVPFIIYADTMHWVVALVSYCLMMSLGMTMGYHRYLSHNQFQCNAVLKLLMLFFAHIMMVGSAVLWVATHRAHHKYSDTPNDPHSPKYKGYFYSQFLQVFTDPDIKYAGKLLKDPVYRSQHRYYWEILLGVAVVLYLIDPFSVIYAWLAPAGVAKFMGSLVFSYSHRNGRAHSDTWLGILTFGEGFHEEHHQNARTVLWHQLDLGGYLINILGRPNK
jgi:stearoyl-CoA desaturase (Delta-9 desaturase)